MSASVPTTKESDVFGLLDRLDVPDKILFQKLLSERDQAKKGSAECQRYYERLLSSISEVIQAMVPCLVASDGALLADVDQFNKLVDLLNAHAKGTLHVDDL